MATSSRAAPHSSNFELILFNNNIYPCGKEKPDNAKDIEKMMRKRRPSLNESQFSDGAFEDFWEANQSVNSEGDVIRNVIPIIMGTQKHIKDTVNVQLANLTTITNNLPQDNIFLLTHFY